MAILHQLFCGSYGAVSSAWSMVLTATGTGAGVARIVLYATGATSATLSGNGHFYTDSAGTLNESQSWSLSAGWNTRYIRLPSGSSDLIVASKSAITKWGDAGVTAYDGWVSSTNAPSCAPTVETMPSLTSWRAGGQTTASGDISILDSTLSYLVISSQAMSGTKAGPITTTYISIGGSGSTLDIDVSNMSSLTFCRLATLRYLTGSVNALASCTDMLGVTGTNFNLSGNLANMASLTSIYAPTGTSTLTYPTTSGTHSWPSGMNQVYIHSQTLPTASIDALLIDLAAQASWTGSKIINLKGTRTSASDAAVATLGGYGVGVTVTA